MTATIKRPTNKTPLTPSLRCRALSLIILAVVSLGLMVPNIAADQDKQNSSNNLDKEIQDLQLLDIKIPVVVTATRREHVPHAMSVITAEDIRLSGARNIPDALRFVPGVDVAQLAYGNSAVSPRGFHGFYSSGTLVLIDGRQVYDAHFGGTLWGNWPFQLEDIERIEVIRGPGGVTWGANAVNGIINIITKDPADQLGLTFTAGGGSRGTHKEHLGYAFAHEKLRLRISGEYEASDGFRKGGSWLMPLDDDSYKSGRMSIHGVYEVGPNDTVTFSAGSALVDDGYPASPLLALFGHQNAGTQANFLLGKWDHKITPDNNFELIGYVNDFDFDAGYSKAIDSRYQQLGLMFSHTFKPADAHTLSWGIDSRIDFVDSSNADPYLTLKNHTTNPVIGLYLQDEWKLVPRWNLNLGGRIDYDSYGGFQPSARASLSYELTDESIIYGAVSRAFNMATPTIRLSQLPVANGLGVVDGDRNIKATTMLAYELGYRATFYDRLQTNINLYWHEHMDQIGFKPGLGPPGLIRMSVEDVGSYSVYGIELDAKYAVTDRLTLLGNYTFQRMDYRASLPFFFTQDFLTPPKHKFMLGARYSPTDDLHLSSHLYYVDAVTSPNPTLPILPIHVDPYFRLDLRAEHEFWNDQASIAVGVRNLLDSNHYEGGTRFLNDAEVPRMIYAEFRMNIK